MAGAATSARQRPSPTMVAEACSEPVPFDATGLAECDQIHSSPGFNPPVQKSASRIRDM